MAVRRGSQGHGELAFVRADRIHKYGASAQPAVEHFNGLHSDRDRPLLNRAPLLTQGAFVLGTLDATPLPFRIEAAQFAPRLGLGNTSNGAKASLASAATMPPWSKHDENAQGPSNARSL